jgi:hypothetical protein
MANKIYPKAKEQFLKAAIDMNGGVVKAILIDKDVYTYDDAHEFLSDVAGGARISVSNTLSGKSFTGGTFDSDDPTFSSVSGAQLEAILLYLHTGVDATSRLIFFNDTGITGMPFTPAGNNVVVHVGAGGWFTL